MAPSRPPDQAMPTPGHSPNTASVVVASNVTGTNKTPANA